MKAADQINKDLNVVIDLYTELYEGYSTAGIHDVMNTRQSYLFDKTPYEVCIYDDADPLIEWLKDRIGKKQK